MAHGAEPLEWSPFSLFWGQDGLRQQTAVVIQKVWLPLAKCRIGLTVKPERSMRGPSLSATPSQALGGPEVYAIVYLFLISHFFPPHSK